MRSLYPLLSDIVEKGGGLKLKHLKDFNEIIELSNVFEEDSEDTASRH
jgi:hypothetical protein